MYFWGILCNRVPIQYSVRRGFPHTPVTSLVKYPRAPFYCNQSRGGASPEKVGWTRGRTDCQKVSLTLFISRKHCWEQGRFYGIFQGTREHRPPWGPHHFCLRMNTDLKKVGWTPVHPVAPPLNQSISIEQDLRLTSKIVGSHTRVFKVCRFFTETQVAKYFYSYSQCLFAIKTINIF